MPAPAAVACLASGPSHVEQRGWRRTAGLSGTALVVVPHRPVVETEHGFTVHSLNPKQLNRCASRQPVPRTATPECCVAD